jgi:hypothetical protein
MDLPPLPLGVLREVEKIEEFAQASIARCWTPHALNVPKAIRLLCTCAVSVFDIEARHYTSLSDCSERWLELIESNTRKIALGLCRSKGLATVTKQEYDEIDSMLRDALDGTLQRWQATLKESKPIKTRKRPSLNLSDEKARRGKLLTDYKAAAGQPSNRAIYTARNSGIHKPEFYDYVNGVLPSTSATFEKFEAFLRAKKPPIPRSPRA